jgi:hypothetical protein
LPWENVLAVEPQWNSQTFRRNPEVQTEQWPAERQEGETGMMNVDRDGQAERRVAGSKGQSIKSQ